MCQTLYSVRNGKMNFKNSQPSEGSQTHKERIKKMNREFLAGPWLGLPSFTVKDEDSIPGLRVSGTLEKNRRTCPVGVDR